MAPHTKAGSGRVSRATSLARDIVKRRDKPYKTEHQTVFAKKRKLDLHTSYHRAPPGYIFLPVGTPELAERCKELSRQRGLPVNVVNAKPINRLAQNPDRVSHHVHRIGYHFKVEVVEDACQELGFVPYQGKYVKESDLRQQRQDEALARTLAQYGVTNYPVNTKQRESPEEVRAAIKELFPKIPEKDLNEIVEHAWEEGTDRVGNMKDLSLSRRVQLATIARIRHTYTDYDRLLRAFEWSQARSMVEPDCLKKLIEWRGENDAEEDEGLEEIVRETIVIDDDDDVVNGANEADDEDSGNVSDTSIEITHHVINVDDFGAESTDDKARAYAHRVLGRRRNIQQRNKIAKQKIDATKQRLRNAGFSASKPIPIDVDQARTAQPASSSHSTPQTASYVPGAIQPKPDQYGRYPEQVIGEDGRVYRLVNTPAQPPQHQHDPYRLPIHGGHYQMQSPAHVAFPQNTIQPRRHDEPFTSINGGQHVVDSIERDENGPLPDLAGQPITPISEHSVKRRLDASDLRGLQPQGAADIYRPTYNARPHPLHINQSRQPDVEVMDLTTPERGRAEIVDLASPYPRQQRQGPRVAREAPTYAFRPPQPAAQPAPYSSIPQYASRPVSSNASKSNPVPYDPTRPMLQLASQHFQALPSATTREHHYHGHAPHAAYSNQQPASNYPPQPQPPARALYQAPYEPPRPVHGGPAPVQWAPFTAPAVSQAVTVSPTSAAHQYIPANGAVAPTQYYYPR